MIQDQFTHLKGTVSRQRIHQLRRKAKELCQKCDQPAIPGQTLCTQHAMALAAKRMEKHEPKNTSKWRQEVQS